MTRPSKPTLGLRCIVDCSQPHTHRFKVCLEVATPGAVETFRLPVWIPGSYMVREFGRHLSGIRAQWLASEGPRRGRPHSAESCTVVQLDKTSWAVHRPEGVAPEGLLRVEYEVYAFDTSVRTAFFSTERGFFNPTSVCLRREGWEVHPHRLQLKHLPEGWSVATAMDAGPDSTPEAPEFEAPDYDAFVDHPVELGRFWTGTVRAGGVVHTLVISGAWPGFDGKRLLRDTQAICQAHIDFWHGQGGRPPFTRYVFLLNVVEDGYGGLEHRASTALICGRKDLPRPEDTGLSEGYRTLLGLISHEYFHCWNVKRLKPLSLCTLDYQQENYTELLWFFEGFTSYYDDLALVRAGLVEGTDYLQMLAKTATTVRSWPGRQVQTVAQASFDAWVKYYRQDENTPNATISYYTKGALVALCLDLTLRAEGRGSLDDVMRHLWQRGGSVRDPGNIGITEDDILEALRQVGGRSYARELRAWVHGTRDLPCAERLAAVGVGVHTSLPSLGAQWGLRVSEGNGACTVKSVLRDSAGETAGLCAGDELLAINGWRVRRLEEASRWLEPRDRQVELVVSRDGRLHTLRLRRPAASAVAPVYRWAVDDTASEAAQHARRAWWSGATTAH